MEIILWHIKITFIDVYSAQVNLRTEEVKLRVNSIISPYNIVTVWNEVVERSAAVTVNAQHDSNVVVHAFTHTLPTFLTPYSSGVPG